MTSERFLARITEAHKIMIPKECRERLDLDAGQIYRVMLSDRSRTHNMNFLARLQRSGQIVIPIEVFEENQLEKGQVLTASIETTEPDTDDN
jgi:bifunctional DNA-binding transcriptional regulator/antitoxin component of YhaV-PrlF toxin-antitoxin module